MNFFNRNRQRSPVDSVRVLKDYIQRLDAGSIDQRKKVSLKARIVMLQSNKHAIQLTKRALLARRNPY